MADEIELPAGCTETGRITIVRFFDPSVDVGEDQMLFVDGALSIPTLIGMLEVAKLTAWDAGDDEP